LLTNSVNNCVNYLN